MGVSFETEPLDEDTEVTGPVVLVLWVASSTEDMDIFATIRNIAPDGSDVFELGQQSQPVPVAKGWLRASHRKLDPALSLPFRPYHAHTEREYARARRSRCVVDVEIWPTSMVFRRAIASGSMSSRATASAARPTRTIAADYNSGAEHDLRRRQLAPRTCCSPSFRAALDSAADRLVSVFDTRTCP